MRHDAGATSLELDQDEGAQRREWRFERLGWLVIALVIAAAIAGVFGDGPVAGASWKSPRPGATVEYPRILRFGASATLTATLLPASATDTLATLAIDRRFLESVDLQRITPEPLEVHASADWVVYRFRRAEAGRPIRIGIAFAPTVVGRMRAFVRTAGGDLDMRVFVLP
jgi:hypothetical protein